MHPARSTYKSTVQNITQWYHVFTHRRESWNFRLAVNVQGVGGKLQYMKTYPCWYEGPDLREEGTVWSQDYMMAHIVATMSQP